MKLKTCFGIFVIALSMLSCSEDNEPKEVIKAENICNSIRTKEEAIKIAAEGASMLPIEQGRAGERRVSSVKQVETIVANSHNSRGGNDTLMYAVDYDDNAGFALVAASYEKAALIGVVEEGSYAESVQFGNECYDYYLSLVEDYLLADETATEAIGPITKTQIKYVTDTIYNRSVAPRVTVNWDQHSVTGNYCPNGICGCGPLAIAMLLSIMEEPKSIILHDPLFNEEFMLTNWPEIKIHKWPHSYSSCTATTDAHTRLAKLCKEIGYQCNAIYSSNGTSVTHNSVMDGLKMILPYHTITSHYYESESMREWMRKGNVIINGYRDNNGSMVGHLWICDGCIDLKYKISTYTKAEDEIFWTFLHSQTHTELFHHYNWGWGGRCNGYFNENVFKPSNGSKYDTSDLGADSVDSSRDYCYDTRFISIFHTTQK